ELLDRAVVAGQELEERVGRVLAVERHDGVGDGAGVRDRRRLGSRGSGVVLVVRGEDVRADPEDVVRPEVAEREAELRRVAGGRLGGGGRRGGPWGGRAAGEEGEGESKGC